MICDFLQSEQAGFSTVSPDMSPFQDDADDVEDDDDTLNLGDDSHV